MTLDVASRHRDNSVDLLLPPLVLIRWRGPFWQFLARTIARQYRTNLLGFVWAVMVPLITLGIYSFVFGTVMKSRWDGAVTADGQPIPFTLYLFAGLIVFWPLAQAAGEACGAVVQHTNLVKRAVFPLEILPLATVGNALFHALINCAILIGATALLLGHVPATALLFPVVLLPYALLLAGLAWALAALGVYFRDLTHIIGLVMTAILFLSPVFYALDRLTPALRAFAAWNPVTVMVEASRAVLLEGHAPAWDAWGRYALAAWIVAALGLAFFRRARHNFADVL